MVNKLTLSVVLFVLVGLLATDALACSCAAKPTVLDYFESSDLVIATRLASVEKIGEKQGEHDISYIRSATMIVTKVFKGNVKPGQALKFAQGGGADCIWTFDETWIGEEFLFYVGKPSKGHPLFGDGEGSDEPMYYAVTCGRSNGLKGAVDDLSYIENLEKLKGKTRLSGSFGAWFDDGSSGAEIKLRITGGGKTYSAKTNKAGFFEIYDLPPGDYTVTIDMPVGWKINDYMLERTSTGYAEYDPSGRQKSKNQVPVRIVKGKHTALDLTFDIDSAISGLVLSPSGQPMKDVCVKAVSTELKEGDYRGRSSCTDNKGEFVIQEMPRGNYILVVNDDGRMSGSSPFGIVFYPGVTEFKNAGAISVEPGKYVTGRTIQIPQAVELITIKGKFLYSDGKPVADERVTFVPTDKTRFDEMSQMTDPSGGFSFRLPKGASGTLSGEMYTYPGEFKNCRKLEALIQESGRGFLNVKSSIVEVDGLEPSELIELSFPFPFCVKSEKP